MRRFALIRSRLSLCFKVHLFFFSNSSLFVFESRNVVTVVTVVAVVVVVVAFLWKTSFRIN